MVVFYGYTVRSNLFALLIAPKGEGKTPATSVFFGELLELEKEDKKVYNERKSSKKRGSKSRRGQGGDEGIPGEGGDGSRQTGGTDGGRSMDVEDGPVSSSDSDNVNEEA